MRNVIRNADGFDSLYPKYAGGLSRTFTLPERREVKRIARTKPTEHDLSRVGRELLRSIRRGSSRLALFTSTPT
ncbi:hypothetical protein OG261_20275 [Streptomyces sp. NBC_01358]